MKLTNPPHIDLPSWPIWWLPVSLSFLLLVACSVNTETREDLFVASGSPRLIVQTENGSISVKASGVSAIQVTSTIRNPSRVDYRALQKGNTVEVIARIMGGSNFFRGIGGADIQVLVPERTDLALESKNGAITIGGVTGQVSLHTSNGSIGLTNVKGIINLVTSNGRVNLTNVGGDIAVRTSNGEVDIRDFIGQVKVWTSNSSINFVGILLRESKNQLKTSNGSVNVTLVETPGTELDAFTTNGRVRISDDLLITAREVKDNRLVGAVGIAGSSLEIRSSNGSITIK